LAAALPLLAGKHQPYAAVGHVLTVTLRLTRPAGAQENTLSSRKIAPRET